MAPLSNVDSVALFPVTYLYEMGTWPSGENVHTPKIVRFSLWLICQEVDSCCFRSVDEILVCGTFVICCYKSCELNWVDIIMSVIERPQSRESL